MPDSTTPAAAPPPRAHWGSRLGFVLAAAGSAVGLGNIWKFPFITGENGGGLFVLIYLVCIAMVGLPVMIAEVIIGRRAERAPVGAFRAIAGADSAWRGVGWLGVVTGFVILSYYSVVAGWAMHYTLLSLQGFTSRPPEVIEGLFGAVYGTPWVNLFWHVAFMGLTIGIVAGGVQSGIEKASRILMPALLGLLGILLLDAVQQRGFGPAVAFLFEPKPEKLSPAGVLEALGHSFFTLSLGMGAMMTYGSYLSRDTDLVASSFTISLLDTVVALLACLVLFPILFTFDMPPAAGPGLVFKSIPIALGRMTGGQALSVVFFVLLVFAALTSAISLLEVVVSTVIDQLGWERRKAALVTGLAILVYGVPSALSGGTTAFGASFAAAFGNDFLTTMDNLATNALLPVGGLLIALYVGWFMPADARREEFETGSRFAALYPVWLWVLRVVVPAGIGLVFLHKIGLIHLG